MILPFAFLHRLSPSRKEQMTIFGHSYIFVRESVPLVLPLAYSHKHMLIILEFTVLNKQIGMSVQ